MILDHREKSSSRARAGKKFFAKNVGKLTKMVKKSEDKGDGLKSVPVQARSPYQKCLRRTEPPTMTRELPL